MSKVNQAVLEGQVFAQEHFSLDSRTFEERAKCLSSSVATAAAIDEFATISQEMSEYYAEDFVPAIVGEDGVPF